MIRTGQPSYPSSLTSLISSASATAVKRYLVVNGTQTEYWTSRENNGTEDPYAAQLNVTTFNSNVDLHNYIAAIATVAETGNIKEISLNTVRLFTPFSVPSNS